MKFLLPMLVFYPERRSKARDCLSADWLKIPPEETIFKYTPQEFEKYMIKKNLLAQDNIDLACNDGEDSEYNEADSEDNKNVEENSSDDEFYGKVNEPINFKLLERSFINAGYIGYGDGIALEELDQNSNWQFEEI